MQLETRDLIPGAATWRTGRNISVVFDSGLFTPSYGNMASSTKPDVHNISHRRPMRTEPRLRVTCRENLVKFELVIFEICERTDRQTKTQTDKQSC